MIHLLLLFFNRNLLLKVNYLKYYKVNFIMSYLNNTHLLYSSRRPPFVGHV